MKKIYNLIALALVAFSGASCVKSALDPLDGKYPEVEQLNLGSVLVNGGVEDVEGFNVFTLKADGLNMQLAGKNWYLEGGDYTFSQTLRNRAILSATSIDGKAVTDGSVTITKNGDDYSLSGLVWCGEEVIKVRASGKLVYEYKEIEANYTYTKSPYENRGYNLTLNNLDGSFAANFLLITSGDIAGTYEIASDSENLRDGQAFIGIDLSFLGLGVLGCYFDVDGTRWFVRGGTVTVSGDESMYSVEISNLSAINALEQLYPESSISFPNAKKEEPKPFVIEGYSFTHTEAEADGLNEHTLMLKDASGKPAGRILIDTAPLGGVIGTFEGVSPLDADKGGKYLTGLDASAFGMGVLGSYLVIDGKQYLIGGGTLTVSNEGETFTILLSNPQVSGLNASSIELTGLTLEAEPDQPKEDVTFEVKGGTYTYATAPKADAEGIIEHTFSFKDAEGNAAGQLLIWSADGTYTGVWPFLAASGTPAPGNFVGGMELDLSAFGLGVSNLGSYFIKDGKTYLLNAGTAVVSEENGKIGVLITGVEASTGASAGSESSDVTVLSFSDMEAYVPPVADDAFTVEGGTYTVSSEDKETVTEYTVKFSDADGNLVAQTVLRTEKGAALESGTFTVAGEGEQSGTYVFGLNFLGMMDIGTFYIKDGKTYYVTDGTLNFVDFFSIYGMTVENATTADSEGNPGAASISISGMTKAE
ncbi:MAG: hypothetical protein IJ202_09935 [Bacteroidales bacterium]|nr:hypothetical protein [Bacteroidales bacterium]